MTTNWYEQLRNLQSRGSQTDVVGGLAGLHAARAQHEGQFFTPDSVVQFMWKILRLDRPDERPSKLLLLDNSFGSGRMFQFADPSRHVLYGIEKDEEMAVRVQRAVRGAGFSSELLCASMEAGRMESSSIDVALINPPFSIHLDNPNVEPFPCNSFGLHGSRSSAMTHIYALAQALSWSRVVAAVMPHSFVEQARTDHFFSKRLCAIYHLPRNTFLEEGADVATSVLVWAETPRDSLVEETLTTLSPTEYPAIDVYRYRWMATASLRLVEEGDGEPVITMPVTGNRCVRIVHDGRKLSLKFFCGAIQGRVLNRVLQDNVGTYRSKKEGRLPAGIEYTGQGKLDLECHLAQDDPIASFRSLISEIESLDCTVLADPAIENWLASRARRLAILQTPLRHVATQGDRGLSRWLADQSVVTGTVKKAFNVWTSHSPEVPLGAVVELKRAGRKDEWSFVHARCSSSMSSQSMIERFNFDGFVPSSKEWVTIHGGLREAFPDRFAQLEARALALGLDKWCSWDYQFHDLIEVAMRRGNTVIGWEMGLGKARCALALCKLGGGQHNLIVVEAHLLKEMVREIEVLGIPKDQWQIIEKPAHLNKLCKINLIAYSRLKMAVDRKHKKITYAKRLRRRIHTLVADEAHLLRNPKTDQSQAVWAVSPRVRYAMSGTPIANYPRDVLPLIQWVAGDGTAAQPYGLYHPFLTTTNVRNMDHAKRGVDVFKEYFVVLEWVTNEFADDLRTGAKREIPRIKDVDAFRDLVAPVVKRRVMEEPEVAKHVSIPRPVHLTRSLPWDVDHAVYYVKAAREFVAWFKKMSEWERHNVGLIAILAKMHAVYVAANYPQDGVAGLPPYFAATSKQRYAIERLARLTEDGHKTIFLANSPSVVDYMAAKLAKLGIDTVSFHGGVTIANRIKALDDQFRFGSCPVLLATKGVLQTGYNIHQADRVMFYDRSWTPKIEFQAAARVLRPQQTKQVEIEYLHLEGSIDTYQAQMVEFKAESMAAGLDYGDDDPSRSFVHIETILGRFVEDFETTLGIDLDSLIQEGRLHRA